MNLDFLREETSIDSMKTNIVEKTIRNVNLRVLNY